MKMKSSLILSGVLTGIMLFSAEASALSKVGSRGTEVRNIQTRLKSWNYYTGWIDGIYGDFPICGVVKVYEYGSNIQKRPVIR